MADDAKLKLTFRLVSADGRPADPVVLDDIVRLIRQAVATAPKDAPTVAAPTHGFREPPNEDDARTLRGLEAKIENRIQEASAASQKAVELRAGTAVQPDGPQKLAAESLAAAQRVVSAVQRAILQRVAVTAPAE